MNEKENLLRTIRFETPEYIPMTFAINDACWNHYDHDVLFDLMNSHPLLFPDFKRPAGNYQPQYLVNGIDRIADKFAGKVCVDLDIDRKNITFSGTPARIDALIREEIEKIGSNHGGLMMVYSLYPGIPLDLKPNLCNNYARSHPWIIDDSLEA